MRSDRRQDDACMIRVTWVGLLSNLALAGVKLAVGLLAGSLALVADGFHSLSDMVGDFAVLFGIHFASKEPDPKHPYGHGRIETFAAFFVATVLIIAGGGMIYQAAVRLAELQVENDRATVVAGPAVIAVALLSVAAKETLYRWTRRVAVRTHSTVLYANAWHHRTDSLSSVAVLIGAAAVYLGYPHGDPLAAMAVALMIILVAVRVVGDCFHELSERAVDRQTLEQIERVLQTDRRICQWHRLRTRSVGREVFVDLHILVDPELNIKEAHQIADTLEYNLHEQISRPVNVVVHVEPDLPELRQ